MKLTLALCLLFALATPSFAEPIEFTVQCSGSPLRETTRSKTAPAKIELTGDDSIKPIIMTTGDGQKCVIQLNGDFTYPTALEFTKGSHAAVKPKDREIRNTGLEIELTPTREGEQIAFVGRCLVTRLASSSTPEKVVAGGATLTATTFIERECKFAGRASLGAAAKINLGEEGIDACELIVTFADAK